MTNAQRLLKRALQAPNRPVLARAVFGTTSAPQIEKMINRVATNFTGEQVATWNQLYVGNGFGIAIDFNDGERLFFKFQLPHFKAKRLKRTRSIHQACFAAGFACPEPLSDILAFRGTYVMVDAYRRPRASTRIRSDATRRVYAEGLCDLTSFINELDVARKWQMAKPYWQKRALWEAIDHPRFQAVVKEKHDWLDDIAREAREVLADINPNPIVGHFDWRPENVLVRGDKIVAIYDWDSVQPGHALQLLGSTAMLHNINWSAGISAPTSVASYEAFFDAYEQERGRKYSKAQRRIAAAFGVYSIATVAKYSYSDDPDEKHWRGSTRAFVYNNAETLLNLMGR